LKIKGSYAGAFGQTQFIPASFREYAVDFDHDGRRDVFNSIEDILGSIANYLHRFHWQLDATIYYELGNKLDDESLIAAYKKGRKGLISWQTVAKAYKLTTPAVTEKQKVSIVGLKLAPTDQHDYRFIAGFTNFQAITKWNHSNHYAMAVTELAAALSNLAGSSL
jgi:membrane-bound lytic murein transglycosylase B